MNTPTLLTLYFFIFSHHFEFSISSGLFTRYPNFSRHFVSSKVNLDPRVSCLFDMKDLNVEERRSPGDEVVVKLIWSVGAWTVKYTFSHLRPISQRSSKKESSYTSFWSFHNVTPYYLQLIHYNSMRW